MGGIAAMVLLEILSVLFKPGRWMSAPNNQSLDTSEVED